MMLNELRSVIRQLINERSKTRYPALRIFDFDDTLTFTGSKIYIRNKERGDLKKTLTPAEYAVFDKAEMDDEDDFDYSDFSKLIEPRKIDWTLNILKRVIEKHGVGGVAILTARGHREPVEEFLEMEGFPSGIEIIALGDSNPMKKAEWISNKIENEGLRQVDFFDDSKKNIVAARQLKKLHPDCRINVRHIKHQKD
jgi:hypothetical protein